MTRRPLVSAAVVVAVASATAAVAVAQFRGGGRRVITAPEPGQGPVDRGGIPTWPVDPQFKKDLFTFARVKYRSTYERQSLAWYTDYPDADLNLSFRLQQYTSIKVDPQPKVVELTDPALFDYPWLFMSGVGNIVVDDEEAAALRRYLLNGGFLMVDDFWGEREWESFAAAMGKVLPGRAIEDVPRKHAIFHCPFDIPDDRPLQTTNVNFARQYRSTGRTWEREDAKEVHYRAIHDDNGRMMVFICHNTDTGDGWEEEGTDAWYFHEFSENKCYPLAFNIVFYAMTH
ncbi:MAG TPA: DUF4159 domain-containing protein [Tepidisphaeraceae bacterium]|nr:DUF4159 domain-containing protein [Tepidisphaeraceae bacterium]